MIGVSALSHIELQSTATEAWAEFAERLIGAKVETASIESFRVRLDERAVRLTVTRGSTNDAIAVGWEVDGRASLAELEEELAAAGQDPIPLNRERLAALGVSDGFRVTDPDGLDIEIVVEPAVDAAPFVSSTGTRFVTGDLGLGHVVQYVADLSTTQDFYVSLLGFSVTDRVLLGDTEVVFLHCNGRHHSLALVRGGDGRHLQHLMLEVADIDMVGTAFDRCEREERAQSTIGRHTNDLMLSFYAQPPESAYTIEYGYGGRIIADPVTVVSYSGTSWWGHKDILPGQL